MKKYSAIIYLAVAVIAVVTIVKSYTVVNDYYITHLPPCVAEDGDRQKSCFWDATKRGNGKGQSFWIDKNGLVHDWH